MKVNSINSQQQPSFRNLITGESILKVLKSERPSNALLYEYDKIEFALRMLEIDAKKNVDVILNHASGEGFFGIISSKKYGIPKSLSYRCKISPDQQDIIKFNNWVCEWDDEYSEDFASGSSLDIKG